MNGKKMTTSDCVAGAIISLVFGVFLGVWIMMIFGLYQGMADTAITQCEENLPRNQSCEVIIAAKVKE